MDASEHYFSDKYSGNMHISDKSSRLELTFKQSSGINYDDFVRSVRSITLDNGRVSKLEEQVMEIEVDDSLISIKQTRKGVELCITSASRINYKRTIENLFEKCDSIRSALPLNLDDFKREMWVKLQNAYRNDVESRTYIEKLDLHIEEQMQMLSEGLGKPVEYVLSHSEINGVVECIFALRKNLMSDKKPTHNEAKKHIKIMYLGIHLLNQYGSEECDEEQLENLNGLVSVANDYFYAVLCEGLDSPYIVSTQITDTKESSVGLTEEQKKLSQTASLEGRLAQALRKEDYEEAAEIKKQIDLLKKE